MARYSIYVRPDLLQLFWAGMQAGDFITDAVVPINTSRRTGRRVLAESGGVRPRRGRDLKGRCLTFAQREEIAVMRAQGHSLRRIGVVVGRSASTVSRELRRNSVAGLPYPATSAHALAYEQASRPKPSKLHTNTVLRHMRSGGTLTRTRRGHRTRGPESCPKAPRTVNGGVRNSLRCEGLCVGGCRRTYDN